MKFRVAAIKRIKEVDLGLFTITLVDERTVEAGEAIIPLMACDKIFTFDGVIYKLAEGELGNKAGKVLAAMNVIAEHFKNTSLSRMIVFELTNLRWIEPAAYEV